MTAMYYPLPGGEPTSNLQALLPQIISPQYLSDAELAEHGVARCVVSAPALGWWQQRGARAIDTAAVPHAITWAVEDRPLAEVKALAWQRIKAERDTRQGGLMAYTYPSGDTHHNEMSGKVRADLSDSVTAALALSLQGVTDAVMPWTVYENVTHWLTPPQMIAHGLAATQWYSAMHVDSQTIRAAINTAKDVAGVVAAAAWPNG